MTKDTDLTNEEQETLDAMMADEGGQAEETQEPETAEEKPVEEDQEEKAEEPKAKSPPEGFVPHQAMHAERMKRQDLEKQLEELRASIEKPKTEEPQWADPLVDPEGHKAWSLHQAAKQEERSKQFEEAQKKEVEHRVRAQRLNQYEAEFAAKTPDFAEAATFLRNSRVSELRAMGWGDHEINVQISNDINALLDAGEAAGINPAQLAYMQATERGYAKAAPAPDPAQKMEAVRSAQEATKSVANTASGAQSGGWTVEKLLGLSEKELAKVPDEVIEGLMS